MLTDIIRNAHLMKTKESRQYNIKTLCHNCMPDLFQALVVLAGNIQTVVESTSKLKIRVKIPQIESSLVLGWE